MHQAKQIETKGDEHNESPNEQRDSFHFFLLSVGPAIHYMSMVKKKMISSIFMTIM
ncbi:hypothetical protein PthBH41_28810 [Parageobacillus thermoglucosidasius]|nr:hypothetical protein B4168_2931 [Anoxybacillus flavithermus]OAO86219.1 hypothetical protein GT23_2112 [Parageobacillus thermoglucosidasius]BDG33169.1 hypothetical protein PthBH41_28810 [Parageobacillus thermoglucosidasius]